MYRTTMHENISVIRFIQLLIRYTISTPPFDPVQCIVWYTVCFMASNTSSNIIYYSISLFTHIGYHPLEKQTST